MQQLVLTDRPQARPSRMGRSTRWVAIVVAALICAAWAAVPTAAQVSLTIGPNPLSQSDHPYSLDRPDVRMDDAWERLRADCYHQRDTLTNAEVAVWLDGPLREGDAARLAEAIAPYAGQGDDGYVCPNAVVFLNSPGGALLEGIAMGRLIAAAGLPTIVAADAVCLSACAFAWAGGSYLGGTIPHMVVMAGGAVGLHKPRFELTDRQKAILQMADAPFQLAFELAGAQWEAIYSYLRDEWRLSFLLEVMLESPAAPGTFE